MLWPSCLLVFRHFKISVLADFDVVNCLVFFVTQVEVIALLFCYIVSLADCSSGWLEGPNKVYIPFLACGDLSGYDSDRSYPLPRGAEGTYRSLDPVQPPIAPPYKRALEMKKASSQGIRELEKLSSDSWLRYSMLDNHNKVASDGPVIFRNSNHFSPLPSLSLSFNVMITPSSWCNFILLWILILILLVWKYNDYGDVLWLAWDYPARVLLTLHYFHGHEPHPHAYLKLKQIRNIISSIPLSIALHVGLHVPMFLLCNCLDKLGFYRWVPWLRIDQPCLLIENLSAPQRRGPPNSQV